MKNFNKAKWFSLIIFLVFVGIIVYLGIYQLIFFQKYSDLISTLSTLSFIYLTFETLRQTRQSETSPYVTVKLIMLSKLDNNFKEKYSGLVMDGHTKQLLDDYQRDPLPNKNLVFINVENIGELTAVEVKIELQYSKQSYGMISKQNTTIPFGTIKKHESFTKLVDFFDVPTKEDFFQTDKCITYLNTANRKYVSDGLKKKDITESINYENFDNESSVIFKK